MRFTMHWVQATITVANHVTIITASDALNATMGQSRKSVIDPTVTMASAVIVISAFASLLSWRYTKRR
jgi:hypothetical protein